MIFTFEANDRQKTRVLEVVHEDDGARALKEEFNPRYYELMEQMEKLTENGAVLHTSLNRCDELIDLFTF